jgi:hypothetical protein
MSLLGFDSVGRLAIAQLPRLPSNTLVALAGSYTVGANGALFSAGAPSSGGAYVVIGSSVAFGDKIGALPGNYLLVGAGTAESINWPASAGSHALNGSLLREVVALASAPADAALTGYPSLFAGAFVVPPNGYLLMGYASTLNRDFEAWIRRPFDADVWDPEAAASDHWSGTDVPTSSWAAQSPPGGIRTPGGVPSSTWSPE